MKANHVVGMLFKSLFLAAICSGAAHADVDCFGVPLNVRNWEDGSGYLGVTLSGYSTSVWVLCSVDQTLGNISPADCKNILATLLAAIAAQRNVDILFAVYTSCASVPSFDLTLASKIEYVTAG
jgi:hypothetical protein